MPLFATPFAGIRKTRHPGPRCGQAERGATRHQSGPSRRSASRRSRPGGTLLGPVPEQAEQPTCQQPHAQTPRPAVRQPNQPRRRPKRVAEQKRQRHDPSGAEAEMQNHHGEEQNPRKTSCHQGRRAEFEQPPGDGIGLMSEPVALSPVPIRLASERGPDVDHAHHRRADPRPSSSRSHRQDSAPSPPVVARHDAFTVAVTASISRGRSP